MEECSSVINTMSIINVVCVVFATLAIISSRKSVMYRERGKVMDVLAEIMKKCPGKYEMGATWLGNEIDEELVKKVWGMK